MLDKTNYMNLNNYMVEKRAIADSDGE